MRGRSVARVAAGLVALAVATSGCSLAPVDLDGAIPLALRTRIVDADGRLLARVYKQNRAPFSIDEVPEHVIRAVLAAEDARFFDHRGYDLRAIARAALINWREGRVVQGGSTITQQYVKNIYFRKPERTLERKVREFRLAVELEKRYSKREILERYLNTVYLGDGAYGLKTAARTYFGRDLWQLSVSEGALLAALIRAPSRYNPREHPRRALTRRAIVLNQMVEEGWLSATHAVSAANGPLGVLPDPPRPALREPYFVEAVKREILEDARLGKDPDERARLLYKGGLTVETTLVPKYQEAAERAIDQVLDQPGDPQAALVSIDPKTGEILAMVAGNDWRASQVNLALGKKGGGSGRQPGSSFKPLVLATALESGIPLETVYSTSSFAVTWDDGSYWSPEGSSGGGALPLDEALVVSSNAVFARLGVDLGAGRISSQAHIMGIESRLPDVPSLALGSGEVSVLDMAAAYATIANHGTAVEPTTIRRIVTPHGVEIEPDQEIVEGAMSPGNAFLLTEAMQGVIERGTGVAADIGRPAAGKTGTTNDYADAWFIGFTPQLVTAVWVGYPQARIPMTSVHGISVLGGTFPALIWKAFMLEALRGEPTLPFRIPSWAFVEVKIDPHTGLLALPWCPGKKVLILREQVPTEYCPDPSAAGAAPPPIYTVITPSPTPSSTDGTKKDDGGGGGKNEEEPKPEPSDDGPTELPTPPPTP